MKKRRENIKNELAYFYKVIKNMNIEDNIKQSKIAVKNLPLEDQIFISYIVKESRTQTELSLKYEVTQPAICQRFNKLRKILRKNI